MAHLVESIVNTSLKLCQDNLPWIGGAIVLFVIVSLALRILAIVLPRGGPKQGK